MIPPSIVLIIYGLITETSIKALFTGAFLPGFMLASFIIAYILIRTRLHPEDAPLPEPQPGDPTGMQKLGMFGGFLSILLAGVSALLLARAAFFTYSGQNQNLDENVDEIFLGMEHHLPYLIGALAIGLALALIVFGVKRSSLGWNHGKGLVPPFAVIGVVLGSIYGGISGITEAAGMGAFAVFLIALFRGEASMGLLWESMMRTLKSTVHIGGRTTLHRRSDRRCRDADAFGSSDDDAHSLVYGRVHGLGWHCSAHHPRLFAHRQSDAG